MRSAADIVPVLACGAIGHSQTSSGASQLPDEAGEGRDVAAIGAEGVDQGRGHDDAVGAGPNKLSDVGGPAHAEADGDRDRRLGLCRRHQARTEGGSDARAPVTPTSDTQYRNPPERRATATLRPGVVVGAMR